MGRVFPIIPTMQVSGTVTVSQIQQPVTVSSIQNPVTAVTYHLKYNEYSTSVTVAAGSTTGTASVSFSDVARLVSVRAYSTYTPFTLEILDASNNVIYRYDAQSGETIVVDGSVNVVLPKTATIRITVSTAPTSNQTYTVVLGIMERVQG